MKGLLLKDLLGLKRYLRTFIVLLLFYIVFAFSTDSAGFLIGMSALLAAMLPMAAFAYDETAVELIGKLVDDGRNHAARAAPRCPEIDENG